MKKNRTDEKKPPRLDTETVRELDPAAYRVVAGGLAPTSKYGTCYMCAI